MNDALGHRYTEPDLWYPIWYESGASTYRPKEIRTDAGAMHKVCNPYIHAFLLCMKTEKPDKQSGPKDHVDLSR